MFINKCFKLVEHYTYNCSLFSASENMGVFPGIN